MPCCYLHLKVPLHLTALLHKTRYNSTKQASNDDAVGLRCVSLPHCARSACAWQAVSF